MKPRPLFAVLVFIALAIPSIARSAGSLVIPNNIAAQAGPNVNASLLDTNWSTTASYINNREVVVDVAANRPAAGTAGRWYFATNTNGGTLYVDTGSTWQQVAAALVSTLAEQFASLTLSNAATNPSTTLGIAQGSASSDDATVANRVLMTLTASITKTTAAWVVGTGTGGLDTGAIAASTWYHVWLIERTDTGVVDALFSTSASSPTMPTNYTKKRRIGSALTDGSSALNYFTQDGDYFIWATSTLTAITNPGTSASSVAVNTPLGIPTQAVLAVALRNAGTAAALLMSDLAAVDQAPMGAGSAAFTVPLFSVVNNTNPSTSVVVMTVRTNTSSQVRFRVSASDANVSVGFGTTGWIDRRGRG